MRVIPFMRYKWWFLLSLSAVTVFAIVFVFLVRLDLGIDFRGGVRMQIGLEQPATVDEVRSLVTGLGVQDPVVQSVVGASGANSFMITAEEMTADQQQQVESELNSRFTVKADSKSVEEVGASFGKETTNRAFLAVAIAVIAIIGYLTFRFEFKFAIPAIVALIHDVGLTLGIYAASNRLVTSATIAAILTILGYSVHDTIIVFDRMRENTHFMKKETYGDMADLSIAQTMVRSINTTVCLLLPLVAILVFGGPTLKDFAFALTIGVVTGTYSSFFVATPLAVVWKEREPRYRKRVVAAGSGGEIVLGSSVLGSDGENAAGKGAFGKTAGTPKPGAGQAVQPRVSRKTTKGKTSSKRPAAKGAKRTSR
ncbi:MAG: protein-export membrane protein SecF [Actinobacteria bacterium RBG_16_64_13]|nr:MAG: protein-export membrane protein SecF [Actinobacteria bacterium RBG_16_64_13]